MRTVSLAVAAGVLLLGLTVARGAEAGAPTPRVTLSFDQLDVTEVIKQLHRSTGQDFVIAQGVTGKVTGRFVDKPLDEVLNVIAAALDIEIEHFQTVWILRRKPAEQPEEPTAPRGAAALLPGWEPGPPLELPDAGGLTPPATPGRPGELPGGTPPRTGQAEIQVSPRNWRMIALMLGLDPGSPPPDGLFDFQTDSGQDPYRDPYQNLPPRARVTANGTIIMPNGLLILPDGSVVMPDGTVYQPAGPLRYNVPWGWRPEQYQPPAGGGLGLNINGWKLGLGPMGGVFQPPPLTGGNTAVYLPPVWFGPNGPQLGQLGGGMMFYWDPRSGQWRPQTVYTDRLPPTVHLGENPPNWTMQLPPGWTYTLPRGSGGIFGNTTR